MTKSPISWVTRDIQLPLLHILTSYVVLSTHDIPRVCPVGRIAACRGVSCRGPSPDEAGGRGRAVKRRSESSRRPMARLARDNASLRYSRRTISSLSRAGRMSGASIMYLSRLPLRKMLPLLDSSARRRAMEVLDWRQG